MGTHAKGAIDSCPTPAELAAYSLGQISSERLDEVAEHIHGCAACVALLDDLPASDSLLSLFRRAGQSPVLCREGDFQQLEQRVHAIGLLQERPDHARELALRDLPEHLGPYRLLHVLGRGGMGVVLKAEHKNLKRSVAIKLLTLDRSRRKSQVRRFYTEMEAVGKLDHPNVVRATDAGSAQGYHFIAMELLTGTDLARVLQLQGPLSMADACAIAVEVAKGLEYISHHHLVHRDIKPSNIMLCRHGAVKILDLGVAFMFYSDSSRQALTAKHEVLGTPDYIAPEQADNDRSIDVRADIYSLGCTLYQLLTGRPPFSGSRYPSVAAKLLAHHRDALPDVLLQRNDLPSELAAILRKMTEKVSQARYGSPREVADVLAPFAVGHKLAVLAEACDSASPLAGGLNTRALRDRLQETATGTPAQRVVEIAKKPLMLGAGALLVAALVSITVWRWPPRISNEQTQETEPRVEVEKAPVFEHLAPADVRRGVRYSLMNVPPQPLAWPEVQLSAIKFDPLAKRLNVSTVDTGLLSIGAIQEQRYVLQVDMHQPNWTGGLGVFWGYQPAVRNGEPCEQCQLIDVRPNVGHDDKEFKFCLWRSQVTLLRRPNQSVRYLVKPLASTPVNIREGRLIPLELTFGEFGLHRTRWDGVELPDLSIEEANGAFTLEDYRGAFGLFVNLSGGTFANASVVVEGYGALAEPHDPSSVQN